MAFTLANANIEGAVLAVAPHLSNAEAGAWAVAIERFAELRKLNTARRLAMFIGQAAAETGFVEIEEDLSYSVTGLQNTWPDRFQTYASAAPYARNPEKLANHVYCDRMGNGDEASGDGWLWRGRGLIQTTGRAAYTSLSAAIGKPLMELPDYMLTKAGAVDAATWDYVTLGCLALADGWEVTRCSYRINGGTNGLAERRLMCPRALRALDPTDDYAEGKPAATPMIGTVHSDDLDAEDLNDAELTQIGV